MFLSVRPLYHEWVKLDLNLKHFDGFRIETGQIDAIQDDFYSCLSALEYRPYVSCADSIHYAPNWADFALI